MSDFSGAQWRKSSRSGSQSDCVELACAPAVRAVRDSKNPAGGTLVFGSHELAGFLAAVKEGRLG